jgi:dynein heavy chain
MLLSVTGKRQVLPTQFWIPRIRLMFVAEDPDIFAQRVQNAFNYRKSTESLLRYHLYIDCMPMEGVGELDQASLKRMTEWAKGAPALSRDKGWVHPQLQQK